MSVNVDVQFRPDEQVVAIEAKLTAALLEEVRHVSTENKMLRRSAVAEAESRRQMFAAGRRKKKRSTKESSE